MSLKRSNELKLNKNQSYTLLIFCSYIYIDNLYDTPLSQAFIHNAFED